MADKAEKKPESAPAGAGSEKKDAAAKPAEAKKEGSGGLMGKTPVLLGGVMLIEAVVLFAGFKFLGGGHPAMASGAELVTEEKSESKSEAGKEGEKGEKSAKPIDKKKSVEVR